MSSDRWTPLPRRRTGSILLKTALAVLLLAVGAGDAPTDPRATSPWPKPLGGPDKESATGVAVDDAGNSFVTGVFEGKSAAFDAIHLASSGRTDVFVAKLDRDAHVLWAVAIGGPGSDEGRAIALSPAGDLYVTGSFSGTVDFDPGPGRTELTAGGSSDAFLLRMSAQGELVWARRLGGKPGARSSAQGLRVAAAADAVWVTGGFTGSLDTPRLESAGGSDAFVAKFDLDGNLLWARRIGGPKDDEGRGLAAGRNGEVWVAGNFEETPSIGPEGGALDMRSAGRADVFLLRLDASGRLLGSGRIGGEGVDTCEGLAATGSGGAVIIGTFTHTADVDPGPGTLSFASNGATDAFVVSVDGNGRLLWAHQEGETGADLGLAVAADRYGAIYTTGYLERRHGESLSWVDERSESGKRTWSLGLQATGGLQALAIAASPYGTPTVAGFFKGETKELREAGAGRVKGFGKTDAFVWRLLPAPQRPR